MGASLIKNVPSNAEDTGLIPGPGRFHTPGATKPLCHNS